MPPALKSITINFDDNITQVDYNRRQVIWTTSGESQSHFDWSGEFTCALNEGYIIDTITTSSDITITNKTNTTFYITTENVSAGIITITSKSNVSKVSIDLTTLTGWDNVTAGEHTISVVAKANGYLDSAKSAAVSFTKASAKVLLEKGIYQFIENPNMNISIDETVSGKMNTLTGNNTYGEQTSFDGISLVDSTGQMGMLVIGNSTSGNNVKCEGGDWKYATNCYDADADEYTTTDTTKLRTIVLEADQQVSPEFYNWAITQGNLVKVEEPSTGETWVLKSSGMVAPSNTIDETINFTNLIGTAFTRITIESEGKGVNIAYYNGSNITYAVTGGDGVTGDNATLTFETAPTGELLTWLQGNGTKKGGSSVSKNWKFNGTPAFMPQMTYSNYVTISGEAYNDTTFVEDFKYIYYADDWSCITFGSAGFWDISKNQYGKNAGNILKFNTEPSGELLAFLQANSQPI